MEPSKLLFSSSAPIFRIALLGIGLLSSQPVASAATVINFDEVPFASGSAGIGLPNRYIARGVNIQTIQNATDGKQIGDTFFATPRDTGFGIGSFGILGTEAAVSPTNVVVPLATQGSSLIFLGDELLFSFLTPVTSVSLSTDLALGELPDLVRLLMLEKVGTNEFRIIDSVSGFDNATNIANNTLSLTSAQPFSYALFETTTEIEGIDNLTFTPVPEPSTWVMAAVGLALLGVNRIKRASNS